MEQTNAVLGSIPFTHYSNIPVFDSSIANLHVGAEEGTRTPTGTTPH